jgi:surface antigen
MIISKLIAKEITNHLAISLLTVVCLFFSVFQSFDAQIVQGKDIIDDKIYLDPVDTAFTVEKISVYTPNIVENLPALEEALFFSQPKSDKYLDKKIAGKSISTQKTQLERQYIVKEGDTISQIADSFGMHVGTLYERNNLNANNIENIKPGDEIIIPAYDTSDSKKWLADLNYKKEQERQRLLALEAERERQRQLAQARSQAQSARNVYTRSNANYTGRQTTTANSSGHNGYPYGWCTYYAASRRNVPSNLGNGGQWLSSAQAHGYSTGSTPQPGAIIVTGESWYGHVGIVESVNPDGSAVISEMNYNGWGVVSSRTISPGNPVVKGYIY